MAVVLVVDDEMGIRELLSEILEDEGHTVELAANAAQARASRSRVTPDLVLLDIWMPDTDGVTLLKEWAASGQLTMPVVMMSGHGTIDHAVEATKIGAVAFLEKPITLLKLLKAVEGALNRNPAPAAPAARSSAGMAGVSSMGGSAALAAQSSQISPGTLAPTVISYAEAPLAPAVALAPESSHTFELDMPLREARDSFERVYFEYHLARENGSMTRVAEKTGLERTHLYRKLKQLGVDITRGSKRATSLSNSGAPVDAASAVVAFGSMSVRTEHSDGSDEADDHGEDSFDAEHEPKQAHSSDGGKPASSAYPATQDAGFPPQL